MSFGDINSSGIQLFPIPVFEGGTGVSSIPINALVVGNGSEFTLSIEPGSDGQVLLGGSGLIPSFATLTSTGGTISFTPGPNSLNLEAGGAIALTFDTDSGSATPAANTITLAGGTSAEFVTTSGAGSTVTTDLTANAQVLQHGWNCNILEEPSIVVASDGATITLSVEQSGGGDLTVLFNAGFLVWDTTPADTVTLTAGTDTNPQINYIYFLESTSTLTVSTASFPATDFAPIAIVLCQSAASLQTDGAYIVWQWDDHVVNSTNDTGHLSHLNFWIRSQAATWASGVAPTLTITPNGGAADNVIFTSASGTVLQLHTHTFPAFAGTPDVYTINDSVTPYNIVTDLNALLTDSAGASMSGKYFSLVIWGVVSQDTGDCKLMVNLPSGSYNNQSTLVSDPSQFATYTIPTDFNGTGFLIAELQLRHQAAASGTWTEIDVVDLRGQLPQQGAGGSTVGQTEFIDNTFRILDDLDNTKEVAFQASGITTATTRTMTVQDSDGTIAYLSDISVGITWNEETGTSATMAVNNGYIANNAGLVTLTLPTTAAVGSVVRVGGKGAGGWNVAQNASEIIHFGTTDTTTGVGGSLASTETYDAVELLCIVADTEWLVLSSLGNITIV